MVGWGNEKSGVGQTRTALIPKEFVRSNCNDFATATPKQIALGATAQSILRVAELPWPESPLQPQPES
jgi:sulfopyruvate decarboxylase TPP-binding subunit